MRFLYVMSYNLAVQGYNLKLYLPAFSLFTNVVKKWSYKNTIGIIHWFLMDCYRDLKEW